MIRTLIICCLAALLAAPASVCGQTAQPPSGLTRLGTPVLHGSGYFEIKEPVHVPLAGGALALVGGLSGIDLDPAAQDADPVFFVISDSGAPTIRADFAAEVFPVFYRVRLGIREEGLVGNPEFLEARRINLPSGHVDAEGIRVDPRAKRLYWTSEEEPPALRAMSPSGEPVAQATLPAGYEGTVAPNGGFEGLAISGDGTRLFAALEVPLTGDGPRSTTGNGSKVRIIEFTADGLAPIRQYIYCVDAVSKAPRSSGSPDLGVSEILWVADDTLLVLERGFSRGYAPGKGNSAIIYAVDLKQAPQAPRDASPAAMHDLVSGTDCSRYPKEKFVDLEAFGIWIDNVEGMTFGRPFKNGDRSLVLVTDDNFAPHRRPSWVQITQFIVLRLKQSP